MHFHGQGKHQQQVIQQKPQKGFDMVGGGGFKQITEEHFNKMDPHAQMQYYNDFIKARYRVCVPKNGSSAEAKQVY